jgi:hypothetical protein
MRYYDTECLNKYTFAFQLMTSNNVMVTLQLEIDSARTP